MTEEDIDPNSPEGFRIEWEEYKRERNRRLHRLLMQVLIIFALGGFTMAATIAYTYITSQQNQKGLCAIRADAERRIVQTEKFIEENPNGIPGISVEQLRVGVVSAKRTRDSLKGLSCNEGRKTKKQ